MKLLTILFILSFLFLTIYSSSTYAQLGDLIKTVSGDTKQEEQKENNPTIVAGLKEALDVGTKNAVDLVSLPDGYFGNELIKVLLPNEIKSFESTLRGIGAGKLIDDFVLSMNRAAEGAAKEATPIFVDAVKEMTFADALKILQGNDNAATLYFQDKTSDKLASKFKPAISNAINSVGVTKYYKEINDKIKTIPMASAISMDLDQYVTDKALSGLFTIVGQEEAKIRKDPTARISDLLKDVFGNL